MSEGGMSGEIMHNEQSEALSQASDRFTIAELQDPVFITKFITSDENQNKLEDKLHATFEHICTHISEVHYYTPYLARQGAKEKPHKDLHIELPEGSETDKLIDLVERWFPYQSIGTLSRITDNDKLKTLLGLFVDRDSLPAVTERVRNFANDLLAKSMAIKVNGDLEGIQRIGKLLLGLAPDAPNKFYTSLNQIYADLDFANYPTNEEATARETDMIVSLIKNSGIDRPTVVEIGCGTGRIPNHLAENLKNGEIGRVIGIDPSPELLAQATEADTTKLVEYKSGTLDDTGLEDKSVDVIIVIGRTLTHLRDDIEFLSTALEWSRALKDGGKVIFDLPSKDEGVYFENRKRHARVLIELGIPISEEEALDYYERVVDSVDGGTSWYERYVPNLDEPVFLEAEHTLRDKILWASGIDIKKESTAAIYGWEGAVNNYYIGSYNSSNDPVTLAREALENDN